MKNVDLLIFDLDGTLVDSKEDLVNAVNFTLKKLKLKELPFGKIVSFIGTGVNNLIRKSLGAKNSNLVDQGVFIFGDYYREHFLDKTCLYPHVKSILRYFKHKAMFVVTNKNKDVALLTLDSLGISKYFKDVTGGDDPSCLKPSVCSLKVALKYSKDRKKNIIIGDMDLDVLVGKKAGILTCAVTYGIGKVDDLIKAKPDYIINNLLELKKIIK